MFEATIHLLLKLVDKGEILNVNKHLFFVKKRGNLEYFLISLMKICEIHK